MRLRKPCEHGFYDGHSIYWENAGMAGTHYHNCPGGEFLPEDAIEQAFAIVRSMTNPRYVIFSEWQMGGAGYFDDDTDRTPAADQVGEPG